MLHVNDVGGVPRLDARTVTGPPGSPGVIGDRSLQVVVGRGNNFGWVDTDRDNPYQDVVSFFGHAFCVVFGRGC